MGASKELFCEERYKEPVRIDVILKKIKRKILEKQYEVIDGALRDEVVSVSSIEYIFDKYIVKKEDNKF